MDKYWVCIVFEVEKADEEYEYVPLRYLIGNYSEETNIFTDKQGHELECATNFCGYNQNQFYFGFPIRVRDLIKENDQNSFNNIMTQTEEYLTNVKKYKYYCSIENDDSDLYNISYAVGKNDEFMNQIFHDWKKPFGSDNLLLPENKGKKLSRHSISEKIKEKILSQDEQIDTLVTTVLSNQKYGKYNVKSNILLIGPTGTGKTEMCKTLANLLDVPIIKKDATKYTSSGYVGLSVTQMLSDLYEKSGFNLEKAQKGIIIIDEFDKLGYSSNENSKVRTKDVQDELLGLLGNEEYVVTVKNKKVTIDTSSITFILCGACQNIFDKHKIESKRLGFGESNDSNSDTIKVTHEMIGKECGIEPELLGRLPVLIQTNQLGVKELKQILLHSKISNLRIWKEIFEKEDNITLKYSDSVLTLMAQEAEKKSTGARGLQGVVMNTLSKVLEKTLDNDLTDCEVRITGETIKKPEKYLVKKKSLKRNVEKYELSENNG